MNILRFYGSFPFFAKISLKYIYFLSYWAGTEEVSLSLTMKIVLHPFDKMGSVFCLCFACVQITE